MTRSRNGRGVRLLGLITTLLALGCGVKAPQTGWRLDPTSPPSPEERDPSGLLTLAVELERRGEVARAAATYGAWLENWQADDPALERRIWTSAALSWLRAGDEARFVEAADGLWAAARGRARVLEPVELWVIALADRIGRRPAPRVSTGTLPPAVRVLLDGDRVPSWRLGLGGEQ